MHQRKVNRRISAFQVLTKECVKLSKVLGEKTADAFDPFLQLNIFDSSEHSDSIIDFPVHPQRGTETLTYLIRGEIEHQNSLGANALIKAGGCQWLTAGRGILHQEKIKLGKELLGFQLWINLPADKKMVVPKYLSVQSEMVPEVKEDGAIIRIVAGVYKGIAGAMRGEYVHVQLLDLKMDANSAWQMEISPENTVFAYIISGQAAFNEQFQLEQEAILLTDGNALKVHSGEQGAHLLLAAAKPLHEPVAWGWPIVMNTQEQVERAFAQLKFGLFLDNDLA